MSSKNLTSPHGDNRAVSGTSTEHEMRENPYSNNVLVGNWYEERFSDKTDKKAITPAIYGHSECLQDKSLHQSDFTQPIPKDSRKDFDEYKQWKKAGRENRQIGEATNIKLWDGTQYEKNITTSKDIMFRIVPEEQRGRREKFDILKKQPKADMMRSYGNSTRTGLLLWRACEERRERNTPIDVSHYKNVFKRLSGVVKPQRCKGPQKKTSIV